MNNETDILSDLIGHYLSDENHTAAEFMTWFLNRILLEEARSREVNIFSLRRRGPIGKDMWGVGVILSVSVHLLVFIVQN